MSSTTVEKQQESNTILAVPTFDMVVHAVARRFYLSDCKHKGWDPYSYPYVDAGSIRRAKEAVDFLGYADDVDLSV